MPFIHHREQKLLYLHVPKTGGGSIEAWLKTLGPLYFHADGVPTAMHCTAQHLRMSDFRTLFGEKYFDHVVMTVRNPYDRIASEFRMQAVLARGGFWTESSPKFTLWLERALAAAARNPFHLDNHIRPQWEFHGSGVEVIKYEEGMTKIIARIAAILGVPPPERVPRIHDTSATGVDVQWDEIDRLRVQEFYRKDFEKFGYAV